MSLAATPDGVLLVDKAGAMTSHDVVNLVRRKLDIKKVGHCGTLDPIATGLLLITIGRGTKIQDLLMSEDKSYSGTLTLGSSTSTQDREGEVIETRDVPDLTDDQIRSAFDKFRGDFYQTPPMVSAKKQGGLGSAIDVPLGHKDAAFVRSHFDAIEARVGDAPRANEIVVAVAVTASGRPLARVGGLQVSEIEGKDGLR